VGVVHHAQRLGLDLGTHAHRHRLDLVGVGVGLGLGADRRTAVGARLLLGARRAGQAQRLALGGLSRSARSGLRSAISTSRAVKTFPRRSPLARAASAAAWATLRPPPWHRDRALLLGELEDPAPISSPDRPFADPAPARSSARADARCVDRLFGRDLRALAVLLALRPLGHQLGALARARDLDLALLVQARVLALAVDRERELLGLEVLVADRDQRVLLDVVPLLLALLDRLGEARQALGVEGIARVEDSIPVWSSWVETDSSSRPFWSGLRDRPAHTAHVAPRFVQLLHRPRPPPYAARRRTCPRPALQPLALSCAGRAFAPGPLPDAPTRT
jgi:hypothetical protein